MNKYIKTDVEGLVKDPASGAILNVDAAKLAEYKKKKKFMMDRMSDSERLNKLESDMGEIKDLLRQLLQR
jgi:hypothetical protein